MKTAMQELFDNLEAIDIKVPIGVKSIFLEKEKEQIKESFEDGISEATNEQHGKVDYNMDAEEYYNQTYNQNK